MNFLSRLLPKSTPPDRKGVISISPGEFSIIRSEDSPKGHRELIFKDAEIRLLKTTREFFLQLQVHDLNDDEKELEDGSVTLEDDDELAELEKEEANTFLVHANLRLGYYLKNGRVAIAWRDIESDEDRFEFLCAETVSKQNLDIFDRAACEAQYGQKYGKKPPANAPESIFDEFVYDYAEKAPVSVLDKPEDGTDNEPEAGESTVQHSFSEGRVIMSAECDLCVYDSTQDIFVSPKSLQGVTVVLLDQGNYEYFLEVRNSSHAVLGTGVSPELNPYVDLPNRAFIFNYQGVDNVVMSYLLRLTDQETLTKFENVVTVAQYEATKHERWEEVSAEQQEYLLDAMTGLDMEGVEEYSDRSDSEEEDDEQEVSDLGAEIPEMKAKEKNSGLEVGHTNDRTFVVRGNRIGVFKNTDRALSYSTTIDNLSVDPSRIMLHEQDRALVIQAKDDPNNLYRMDLETGKIVDEWDVGKDVVDFNPVSKFAPTTAETNLLGVADRSMFRIDPRLQGGKIGLEKTYTSKVHFSNVATTASGYVVVGNKSGQLRLYDKVGKIAKTLIPGLGDPFVGLDVTHDGKYVLATCARYLLVIQTANSDYNGFVKAGSGGLRPRPIKLTISPENVVFMTQQTRQPINFTRARFNTGVDAKEATIVTSTGPYLVIWSLHRVLRGETNAYRIKKYGSQITAEDFKFGTDQRVILTLEDDVNMVAKSALKSPNTIFKPRK